MSGLVWLGIAMLCTVMCCRNLQGISCEGSTVKTQENLVYYFGDHFQFWVGPTVPQTVPNYAQKMAHLKRVFQSCNIIKECINNWRDGLISEPFTWHLKGADGERTEAPEAELQLQRWLDWVQQQAVIADPSCSNFQQADPWSEFVLSLGVTGQGALRLWQPDRYSDASDLIHQIHLHAPKTGSVHIERNSQDGFIDEIRYSFSGGQETHTIQGDLTLVEVPGSETSAPLTLDTGGRWLIQHCAGRSLLTPSIKNLQNSINHSLTMKLRNNEITGFRERVFANAEYPDETIERGPGIDQYLYGIETEQANGARGVAPVTIHESQPIDNASLTQSINLDRMLMYLEFCQGHLLSAGDGSLSGESRIQMRGQFELNLKGWKRRIESAIAAILNIVLRLLGYESYEVVVGLTITTGKLSAEERSQIISEFNAGLMSRATAIAKLGTVADVDAELALMAEEADEQGAARDDDPELPRQPRPTEDPDDDDPE